MLSRLQKSSSVRCSRDADSHSIYDSKMTMDILQKNWGLVAALVVLVPVVFAVIGAAAGQSRIGKLNSKARVVKSARKERSASLKKVESLEKRVDALVARGERVPPAKIEQAKAALSDAIALARVAEDQQLIAETQLRRFILEEFAPTRHDALKRRYMLIEPGG